MTTTALNDLESELVRARGFIRGSETQLLKTEAALRRAISPTPPDPRTLVWFEITTTRNVPLYVKHAEAWAAIGEPIVTSRPNNAELISRQITEQTGLVPVSGIKINDLFLGRDVPRGPTDAEAWAEAAAVTRRLAELTGKPVILDYEMLIKAMVAEGAALDTVALAQVVAAQDWPHLWLWYAPNGWSEAYRSLTWSWTAALREAMPAARFIEPASAARPDWKEHAAAVAGNLARTRMIEPDPLSIIHFTDSTDEWPLSRAGEALDRAIGRDRILYPGLANIERHGEVDAEGKEIRT